MSSPILVDDYDPVVQYDPQWIVQKGVIEVDGTRHGADKAGFTASLSFSGTGVHVVGSLESSDKAGQPVTHYQIDGQYSEQFSAPYTPPGQIHYNTTFFSVDNLPYADHTLVITNIDAADKAVFWLDYFLVYGHTPPISQDASTTSSSSSATSALDMPPNIPPSTSASPSGEPTETRNTRTPSSSAVAMTPHSEPSTQTLSSRSTSAQVSPSPLSMPDPSYITVFLPASQSANSSAPSPLVGGNADAVSSMHHANAGAIIGGVIGAVLFLSIFAAIVFLLRRRRRAARRGFPDADLAQRDDMSEAYLRDWTPSRLYLAGRRPEAASGSRTTSTSSAGLLEKAARTDRDSGGSYVAPKPGERFVPPISWQTKPSET